MADDEEEMFKRVAVRVDSSSLVLAIQVDKQIGKLELTGITGRRYITPKAAQDIVWALEEAIGFLERNPPKREPEYDPEDHNE